EPAGPDGPAAVRHLQAHRLRSGPVGGEGLEERLGAVGAGGGGRALRGGAGLPVLGGQVVRRQALARCSGLAPLQQVGSEEVDVGGQPFGRDQPLVAPEERRVVEHRRRRLGAGRVGDEGGEETGGGEEAGRAGGEGAGQGRHGMRRGWRYGRRSQGRTADGATQRGRDGRTGGGTGRGLAGRTVRREGPGGRG